MSKTTLTCTTFTSFQLGDVISMSVPRKRWRIWLDRLIRQRANVAETELRQFTLIAISGENICTIKERQWWTPMVDLLMAMAS